MAYIFNISCLIAAFLLVFGAYHFWGNYKRTRMWQFKNYSFTACLAAIAFFALALPKLILFNPVWIQIDFVLVDLVFGSGDLFLIVALISFIKRFSRFQKIFFQFFLLLLIIYGTLNIFYFSPSIPLFSQGTLYYWKNGNFLLHSPFWLLLSLIAGINGILFLVRLKEIGRKGLLPKTLLVGLASLLIFVAGILFWYFKFLNPLPAILNISGIVGVLGLIFLTIGWRFFR